MARARVSTATLRRLESVEELFDNERELGGVLCVPAIEHDLDAWERRAMLSQQKLVRESQEDADRRVADPVQYVHPLPAPVVAGPRTHTPDPHRAQEARPLPPLPPRPPMGLTR